MGRAKSQYWESTNGRVRLYNADALSVLPMLSANSVHCVFTDPPYGHNNNNGDLAHRIEAALGRLKQGESRPARPILNDGPEANDLFRSVLPLLHRVMIRGACICCCCGGGGPDPQFARWSLWLDEVFQFKQMVIWDKGPMGLGWHYRRSYETVLVAVKQGARCAWFDTSHRIENVIRPSSGIRKIIPKHDDHPTPKPPELAEMFIRLHTRKHQWVLDPFTGGGSTGEAAVKAGRKFIGIELDREHFERSRDRLAAIVSQRTQRAA